MNYLYREDTVSNSLEGVLILGPYLVAHHHSTLLIYNHNLALIRRQYFYEKILSVKRSTDSEIAILFTNGKLVQCDIGLNPQVLRVVNGWELDLYNEVCVVRNETSLHFFNINDEEIREFSFSKFGIYAPTYASLINDYVSKLLLHSYSTTRSLVSIINLDGNPSKVDEFEVLDEPVCFNTSQNLIVVANRNFIQVKYRRESFVFHLNQNMDESVLAGSLRQNVIQPTYDSHRESTCLFLEKPVMFMRGDVIYIINGNGEFFNFELKMEPKKIQGVHISFHGKLSRPSSISVVENMVCVGSLHDDTVMYDFTNGVLTEKARLGNIGIVTSFTSGIGRELLLATSSGIYKANFSIDIQVHKKSKLGMRITGIAYSGEYPVMLTEDKAFKIGDELELTEVQHVRRDGLDCGDGLVISLNTGGLLCMMLNERLIKSFSGVAAWGFDGGMLALVRNGCIELVDTTSLDILFTSRRIGEFEDQVLNEEIITGPGVYDISQKQLEMDDVPVVESGERIYEVKVYKDVFHHLLLRTARQLYIYRYNRQRLTKVLISKPISFQSVQQALFNLEGCIYCRSRYPCIIAFRNGVYVYDASISLGYPVVANGWVYAISKGHVVKCRISGYKDCIFTDGMLLSRVYASENEKSLKSALNYDVGTALVIPSIPQVDPKLTVGTQQSADGTRTANDASVARTVHDTSVARAVNDAPVAKTVNDAPVEVPPKIVTEEYRSKASIKHIISLEDCRILAVSREVPFFYRPFIPMVHITEGPDGKPHSEPINKDENLHPNRSPVICGRTLRYAVELRSVDFKLISAYEMEENEFICDIKVMFDSFLVVCISYPEGEDKMSRGKLTVYSLVNIVPDPKNPHITKKLKLICTEKFKDPCICCVEVRSLIAVCIGTKLMIYEFNENTGLSAVGRNEISLLCTAIFATKNLIGVSDIMNGVHFFFLRPRDPLKLHLLSRSCRIPNCRFLGGIDFSPSPDSAFQLSLIAVTKYGAIQVLTYSPSDPASKNGNQLVMRAAIETKLSSPLYHSSFEPLSSYEYALFSSNVMARVCAVNFPKIQMIQHCITIFVTDRCGINVRNYTETPEFVNPECRNAVCEKILLEFFYFTPAVQRKICELVRLDYYKVSGIIENCLHTQSVRKISGAANHG